MNRIKDKIEEIEKFLEELEPVIPDNFEKYKEDFKIRAICERYFEKIVEAIVDLAFLVIKKKKLGIPKEDGEAFVILANNKFISQELAEKLKDAKGMRNILAHEYGEVDDELVFEAVSEELEKDIREFLMDIEKLR